ncbi:MAG: pitrilysin family protein [Byssovorax sp.]
MKTTRILPVLALSLGALSALGCETTPEPVVPAVVATGAAPVATTAPVATAAPVAPPDPATVTEGDLTIASFHGMEIYVKRIPGAEMSSTQLFLRGGVRDWSAENAGVEELALSAAASGGTEKLDKDAFAARLAELGSVIDGGSGNDYAVLSAKSLTREWEPTFALFTDAFLHPALPAAELEVQRQRQLTALRREEDSPDGQLRVLVHRSLFTGHPYENRAIGTKESVQKVSLGDARAALGKLRETNRMLLVVVGDLDPAKVIEKAKAAFGELPRGNYQGDKLPPIAFSAAKVRVEDKKLPTNYIESVFPAPGLGDAGYPVAVVGMAVLHDRLFEEVRTKRNLSYAPGAHLSAGLSIGYGLLYVTAKDPGTTMTVMLDEVKRMKSEPVPDKELAGAKSVFLTGYLMENESTDGQGRMLARARLLGGDYHLAKTLPDRIRAVTAAEVEAFFQKQAVHMQTTVLGDPSKIDQSLFGSM